MTSACNETIICVEQARMHACTCARPSLLCPPSLYRRKQARTHAQTHPHRQRRAHTHTRTHTDRTGRSTWIDMPQGPQPAYSILVLTVPGSRQLALTPLAASLLANSTVNSILRPPPKRISGRGSCVDRVNLLQFSNAFDSSSTEKKSARG